MTMAFAWYARACLKLQSIFSSHAVKHKEGGLVTPYTLNQILTSWLPSGNSLMHQYLRQWD